MSNERVHMRLIVDGAKRGLKFLRRIGRAKGGEHQPAGFENACGFQ